MFPIVLLLLAFAESLAAQPIKVWERGQGNHFQKFVKPVNQKSIDIPNLISKNLFDVQYQKKSDYQGYYLSHLLKSYDSNKDTALLHISNGMRVPIPMALIQDHSFDPFIAVKMIGPKGNPQPFPKLMRKDSRFNDPRPLVFTTNKLVISHDRVPLKDHRAGLNPFRFTTSLEAIEMINYKSWLKQFSVNSSPETDIGLKIFASRCQYCHGVRSVGATFGWDFVEPLAIYQKRSPENLLLHVKFQKMDAVPRGLLMPPQFDFSPHESKALWQWLKNSALKAQQAYQ
ncbi:c-type cytochrome [Pseudobacteriovorax antillogorgiicola]|uniref:Cytochrome c domain-containing protein n=1 Tax=Pseudobacteriovorax antillogorgiicola TaxID=1513793 RepID=A0A1Y6BHE8_9BACT|nr:cytochrome c [Pseudobacteriovorax antillogorgiicola]TCS55520.1 hypothetical protein EDD56_105243 [Pseudobacteriovorax antillogorgiicola]SMF11370.1 hypothetical protein SAMN06296036_10581 [Pseudobacteriovorax antillogorgiicola]